MCQLTVKMTVFSFAIELALVTVQYSYSNLPSGSAWFNMH